jgi:hypothetical protein
MADFALWAAACETVLWPAGTFGRAYAANRRTAIENMIETDPVATCVLRFMAERSAWLGSAADFLRSADSAGDEVWKRSPGWPKTPRALAGRLRRAQTVLRVLGIDIAFSREGRAGSRMIRIRATRESTVSAVSSVCDQAAPRPAGDGCDQDACSDLVRRPPAGPAYVTDGADGTDANAGLHFGSE